MSNLTRYSSFNLVGTKADIALRIILIKLIALINRQIGAENQTIINLYYLLIIESYNIKS